MLKSIPELTSETVTSPLRQGQFQIGDRVKTNNKNAGTVIRVGRDKYGVYIIVRLDISPREFAYDPDELEKFYDQNMI
jgi:hypothetical protein